MRQAASRLAAHNVHKNARETAEAEEPTLTPADAAKIVDTRWRDTQLGWLVINAETRFICLQFECPRNYLVLDRYSVFREPKTH